MDSSNEFMQVGQSGLNITRLGALGRQRHKASPSEVAIAWTLKNPAVTGAIVAVRNAQQAWASVGAASFELTFDEVAEIEDRVVREAA